MPMAQRNVLMSFSINVTFAEAEINQIHQVLVLTKAHHVIFRFDFAMKVPTRMDLLDALELGVKIMLTIY